MAHLRLRLLTCVAALIALAGAGNAFAAGNVVISQVYGGGGNAGSTIKQDFIELHNRTTAAISLAGWSVQYAATGGYQLGEDGPVRLDPRGRVLPRS